MTRVVNHHGRITNHELPEDVKMRLRFVLATGVAFLLALIAPWDDVGRRVGPYAQGCDPVLQNPIVCENLQATGVEPPSLWDISGSGDSTIQGFTTDISVNVGGTIGFKVESGGQFEIIIYRIGYYGGNGARRIATLGPFASINQPDCISNSLTGLIDCGNWSQNTTWTVPSTAISGVYLARLRRTDTGGDSHILFVVRDDARQADVIFQTSDTTWHAYNRYGGNSLYVGAPGTNPARAYKVSYNRPITTRGTTPEDFFFNAEYPMVRWLEANGFDVTYMAGPDADRFGTTLLLGPALEKKRKVFLSVGHDEYWSGPQRTSIETARNNGIHLAFLSGNEVFWKTRWEQSIAGPTTQYRTLVSYKETHANAKIDPSSLWTGTWRDPRFSPPADGGRPENALTGTVFSVNAPGPTTTITVAEPEGKLRLWRNTSLASLPPGGSVTFGDGMLGYEWDEELDNGFRPPGLMRLSSTTTNVQQKLQDYGSTYAAGVATHNLTTYRHASGAFVFSAGTVQWSWGLDGEHDRGGSTPDLRVQQAMVNVLADMGSQGKTLQAGLTGTTQSSDTLAPLSTITSPAPGSSVPAGTPVTITGTASDSGGGIVALVDVSVDGGTTWQRATGRGSWSLSWTPSTPGSVTLKSRAVDDSGNMEVPGSGVTVTVPTASCPCSIWPSSTVPDHVDADTSSVEVGLKFQADVDGFVAGVRFYKYSVNTGTHVGNLWTAAGTRLATVTFTNETASGWQEARFSSPVAVTANTTYVVSYFAPGGRYAANTNYFATSGVSSTPLRALSNAQAGGNAVYQYGTSSVFPTNTYQSENYWVDLVFETSLAPDTTPPIVSATSPTNGATGVSIDANVTATFNEAMAAATIASNTFELRDPGNVLVPAVVTYDSASRTATLDPSASLALATTYTATVRGGATDPRVKDVAGNALAANVVWSFTTSATPPPPDGCPCSIWSATTTPDRQDADPSAVELGVRFRASTGGYITGIRFYKYATNTGTHIGNLWTNTGTRLATVTFTGESASGWQTASFATPQQIVANTTYVASYYAPVGRYGVSSNYFTSSVTNGPLRGLTDGEDGANGVYRYTATSAFPNSTFQSENYWVDVVFVSSIGPDTTPPTVSSVTPPAGQSGVSPTTTVSILFSEAMDPATISTSTIELRDPANALVPATVTYSVAARTATLTPNQPLAYSATHTVTVRGGATDPRVKDVAGNALAANFTSSFTVAAPPPPPPDQGPGGPILVIGSAANPFGRYYAEILRAEGFNAFTATDISLVTDATLTSYDVVILGEMPLTDPQVTMFSNWVTGGGNLIAMRPDKKLAGLLGLTDALSTLSNSYLLIDTATTPGAGLVGQTIQFHGIADRYTTAGAAPLATLYSTATTSTNNPAVTLRSVGAAGGQASAFTFDLARSIVYTRQGNPAWSGQDRDANGVIRSNDLFYGAASGDSQPDWVNLTKIGIPQADEQQRLLGQLILHMNADRKPLPRFWYLPRDLKAVVVMTGDDHATGGTAGRFDQYKSYSIPGCAVGDWACIRSTSYIYSTSPLTNTQAAAYEADGFEVALHVHTNCANWTPATLPTFYTDQLANFRSVYTSVPSPTTNRTHCIAWSDYATQPDVELANGIRLDTTYYHYPAAWIGNRIGYMTGSAMPMRFARATGEMIDVYQAHSHMTDESSQAYPQTIDTLLDQAIGSLGYYGVFTANMHTDQVDSPGSDFIINSAIARNVPVVSSRQMLAWLDGRNGSSFGSMVWSGNQLFFDIAVGAGATNLRAMVPTSSPFGALTGIQRNGVTIPLNPGDVRQIKGIEYRFFSALAGSYRAVYGTDGIAPAISAVTATPSANGTASVTWTTDEASDSRVDLGTNPDSLATGTVNPALVTAHSVPLSGLTAGTTYYYRVRSADAAANAAVSPNPPNPPASFVTPSPSIVIADASIAEGNAGTATLTLAVTLSAPSSQTVSVNYATANGTATAGADYTAASGTLTFNPSVTTQNVSITVAGDTLDEANETILVNLSNATNATIGDAQGVGTIVDDDPSPSLNIADTSVTEGNTGIVNASFAVTLSAASGQTVTVSYATANGTATATDYTTTSGTLTFSPGTVTQNVIVPVTGDTLNEANETFTVTLSNPVGATIADGQATGTITNDDPVPSISVADVSFQEGNSGNTNAAFTLTVSAVSGQAVSVAYATANGTATSPGDYVATSGTANIPAGASSVVVNVSVVGDTVLEPNETFLLNLSSPVNATIADPQATGTIINDEGLPTLTIGDVTVTEGNSGTTNAVFTVTVTGGSIQNITVDYATANGTATAGSDYTAASGTLTILAGATTGTITVPVIGDTAVEASETFTVNLTNPANAVITDGQATGTITSDDGAPGLVAAYGFNETSGTNVLDSSGNNLTGVITGATRTTTARSGQALTFDGTNDWVTVNDAAALDVTRTTLEAWVRPTTLSGWRTAIMKESAIGLAYALYAHDNAPRPSAYMNTGGPDIEVQGTSGLPLNTWTHLAMTFDGTVMRLYVNGAQVNTRNTTGNIIATGNALRIGGNALWGEYFAGQIDEVRIYNRALTQAEIQTDMNTPVP
jgi:hypothetical protein